MIGWWEAQLKAELSQGDVLQLVYLAAPGPATLFLKKGTAKNNIPAWFDSTTPQADPQGRYPVRQTATQIHAIVVSHDCDLDKGKTRVLIAPVGSLDSQEPAIQEAIASRRFHSRLPLFALPTLGSCFADLRAIGGLDRRYVDTAKRIASMSKMGVEELQNQLIASFTRLDFSKITPLTAV